MRRCAAGIGDHALADPVRVPRFHRRPLVGRREAGEDGVARVDLGEIALDDLRLVTLGSASKVAPHRIDGLPAQLLDQRGRTSTVFVGVGRASQVDPAHTPRVRTVEAGLETFANPGVTQVEMTSDELSAICPLTGQPDLYATRIEYRPEGLCLESKSLKLYLGRFRNEPHFCEALAVRIRDDVASVLELPREDVTVRLVQKARGGITITATT